MARDFSDVEVTGAGVRGACLVDGCACKDARIVSRRRAAFVAVMAVRSGQTAQRIMAAEADWRIPLTPLTDLEPSVVGDEPTPVALPIETIHVPAWKHDSEADR